jgi:hypothetical protein
VRRKNVVLTLVYDSLALFKQGCHSNTF